jgi:hypothetical protein
MSNTAPLATLAAMAAITLFMLTSLCGLFH